MKRLTAVASVFSLIALLTSCSTGNKTDSSGNVSVQQSNQFTIGVLEDERALSRNLVWPYENEVPDFPTKVKDYALLMQSPQDKVRVFDGDGWKVPIAEFNPDLGGGATMSCETYYWILRWRSNNPDIQVSVSTGLTDGPFEASGKPESGGAGISEGFSCFVPAFNFGSTLNGSQGNLLDVNYEYQLWEHKPKI